MELSHPLKVITPTLDGDVLAVLAGADVDFTATQIHHLVPGRSRRGITEVLGRLADQGIVLQRRAGRTLLYRLNREHLAASHVVALSRLHDELLDRLTALLSDWECPPVYGALFGSGARRTHRSSSDLDLFLVRSDSADDSPWESSTTDLASTVTGWTGNDVRLLIMTKSQVESSGFDDPVLHSILEEGIPFIGDRSWFSQAILRRGS